MTPIGPGDAQPYPVVDAAAIAELFAVPVDAVHRWQQRGLPVAADGIDPMACCNWLSWGRLHEAPALARRWRAYLATFAAHRRGERRRHRITWDRRHSLYLPAAVTGAARWWLPSPLPATASQRRHTETPLAPGARFQDGGQLLERGPAARPWTVHGRATVTVATHLGASDTTLAAVVRELVAEFRYGYRRHDPDEPRRSRLDGTCLDCALALGARLDGIGRPWRLCGGLTARTAISNAHFWLEVAVAHREWTPVDPSIPAVARMLGVDWEPWVDAYLGAVDARRITLACAAVPAVGPPSPVPGRATVQLADGTARDAWPCIDWVCGETAASFTVDPAH